MSQNIDCSKHRKLLKELIKKIYNVKTIDYDTYDDMAAISFGVGKGMIASFTLATKKSLQRLNELFEYTFFPPENKKIILQNSSDSSVLQDLSDNVSEKTAEYFTLIADTLKSFIDNEMIQEILEICAADSAARRKRFIPTTESVFEVMAHYDTFQGIPMICTEEQFQACKEKYGRQYDSDTETDTDDTDVKNLTLEEFCRKYPDAVENLGKSIYILLTDIMIPVFSMADISEQKLEADYNNALDRIKTDLTELFEQEARKKLCANKDTDAVKKIVLIDKDCKAEKLKKKILYYPDCAPVLSNWKIPVHQYIKYHKPEYSAEEIEDVLLHPARLNSTHFPLGDLQADEQTTDIPISEKEIPYCQGMFYDFQIQYWTSENKFQSDGLFLQYNADIIISSEIKERWTEQIKEHWLTVLDSVKEILEKIFAVDFICLIKEVLISDVYFITLNPENTTYYYEQDDEYAVVCNQEEADYGIRYFEPPIFIENGDELLNQYLAVFCQEKAVKYDENTFSAFLPQKLIQRHYFIKQMKSPGFAALFGEDFVEQYSMRQVAYVVIPLIGKFVSELKKSLYDIAVVAGDVLTKKEFDSHVKQLEKYLESDALDKAVQEWNTAYRRQKKYELQRKRRSVQGDITINPDDRLMGLMKYSEENGNLFSNLKGVLEEYLYCLKELC